MQRSRSSTLLVATTSLTLACGEPTQSDNDTVSQALVDLATCTPKNLALNTVGSGTPNPLESDATASGNLWQLLDGETEYASATSGVGFPAGGTHQVTIDLGGHATVDQLSVWHRATSATTGYGIPASTSVEIFDGSSWQLLAATRAYDLGHPQPGTGFGSYPDVYSFSPVEGSKLRWSYDGDWRNVLGGGHTGGSPAMNDAVAVVAGHVHSCALRQSGQVVCWGWNEFGQLGTGSTSYEIAPTPVVGVNDATSVAASAHTCALREGGSVLCWGYALGNGLSEQSTVPVAVQGIDDATKLAVGAAFTCALKQNGGAACWGRGQYGNLGDGNTATSTTPVLVANVGASLTDIATGSEHACAVSDSGTVHCWGRGSYGQLGNGSNSNASSPVVVESIDDAIAVAAPSLGRHTCALRASGAVMCWGWNLFGQLGNGTLADSNVPVAVPGLDDAVGLVLGREFSCAVRVGGSVVCWGAGNWGQLGNGTLQASGVPVAVSGLSVASANDVAVGTRHACALIDDGQIVCWGSNIAAQLGKRDRDLFTPMAQAVPPRLGHLENDAAALTTGLYHSCALRSNGSVACWGDNEYGQLGAVDPQPVSEQPTRVSSLSDAVAVDSGALHNCAVRSTGTVACWGQNDSGQLGNGGDTNSHVPVDVVGLADSIAISAGYYHTCAVRASGSAACWGSNTTGQLGNGLSTDSPTPVAVVGVNDGTRVAAGGGHNCVLRENGEIACWGQNSNGQLGNGTTTGSNVPVAALGVTNAISVGAGWQHSCALRDTGGVLCWGLNNHGQLGDGTTIDSVVPVTVVGLTDAVSLDVGEWHGCAIRSTGQTVCWGYGAWGGLGNGGTSDAHTPVAVSGLTDTVLLGAGLGFHACAARASGEILCWGLSGYGQLGSPVDALSSSPVLIAGFAGPPYQAGLFEVSVRGCPEVAAPESGSETSVPAGGSVTTDLEGDGATLADPVETQVTTPTGGNVSIQEEPLEDMPPPDAFQLFDQQVVISAPDAELADPLVLTFTIDASLLPPGAGADDVEVFRNDSLVGDCAIPAFASPDPCVASRELVNGDVVITVLTTEASVWTFGVATESDLDGDGTLDFYDECAETLDGAVVDEDGCAVSQHCPCDGPRDSGEHWRNHGRYVSCVGETVNTFVANGLLSEAEGEALVASAGQSTCGRN